jgi:hypothetical protein
VINTQNRRHGNPARRGDGTFGESVPGEVATVAPGFQVGRGVVATIEIGAEVKIMHKAMIKQIDRVIGDLSKQVVQFRHGGGNPISVALVGINQAPYTVSYEGDRSFRTDGTSNRHPVQEAQRAEDRLRTLAAPNFDEFIVLRYRARNEAPFEFEWVDEPATVRDYGAALVRIIREYDRRFV